MKKNKIATFKFGEYYVDVTEESDRFELESIECNLYKKGCRKKYNMFSLLKRDVEENMQEGDLEELLASNIQTYINLYEKTLAEI